MAQRHYNRFGYYFNYIRSLDDIYNALEKVFKTECKPFKLQFTLSGVFGEYNFCPKCRLFAKRGKNKVQKMDKHINIVTVYLKRSYLLVYDFKWEPFIEFCTCDFERMDCAIDNFATSSTLLIDESSLTKTKDSLITKLFDTRTVG